MAKFSCQKKDVGNAQGGGGYFNLVQVWVGEQFRCCVCRCGGEFVSSFGFPWPFLHTFSLHRYFITVTELFNIFLFCRGFIIGRMSKFERGRTMNSVSSPPTAWLANIRCRFATEERFSRARARLKIVKVLTGTGTVPSLAGEDACRYTGTFRLKICFPGIRFCSIYRG